MRDVYIIGVHTVRFGKHLGKSIKDLAGETARSCLEDAGLERKDIQALWFANSAWGDGQGQLSIRGQVALRQAGFQGIPITNVENACASGSTALHHAWLGVAGGLYDIAMAVGAEKLYRTNKTAIFAGFIGGIDVENCVPIIRSLSRFAMTEADKALLDAYEKTYGRKNGTAIPKKRRKTFKQRVRSLKDELAVGIMLGEKMGYDTVRSLNKIMSGDHSPFMDIYGYAAREHMKRYGTTVEQLAAIAEKSHFNSTRNPNAQFRFPVPSEKILSDRLVSFPLTRSMCAPIGDGAASAILCDGDTARRLGVLQRGTRIRASIIGSGMERPGGASTPDIGERLSVNAYEAAGVGPEDIDLAEVHDATAFGEVVQAENLGFCPRGEGGRLARAGETRIGGKIPINTSGGLISRGHPIGASGLAQIHELVTQLRGEAGSRQVPRPRVALAENGGGMLSWEEAAMCIHILEAPSPVNVQKGVFRKDESVTESST